jgi:hypothetical protein
MSPSQKQKWHPQATKVSPWPWVNAWNALRNKASRDEFLRQQRLNKRSEGDTENEVKSKPKPPKDPKNTVPPGSFNVSRPGTPQRDKVEKGISAAIEASKKRNSNNVTVPQNNELTWDDVNDADLPPPSSKVKDQLNNNSNRYGKTDPMQQWRSANPKLAKASDIRNKYRNQGQSPYSVAARKEISKVLYNKGTKAYAGEQVVPDAFDIIKEYLFNEGYATTEEDVHVIMTNMNDKWKNNILEQMLPPIDPKKHKSAQKTQKIYNKATQGAGSEKDFLKRTGPQLPGV